MGTRKRRMAILSVCVLLGMNIILLSCLLIGGGKSRDTLKGHVEAMIGRDCSGITKIGDELEYLHAVREWVFSNTMLAGTGDYYKDRYWEGKGERGTREYYENMYNAWKREGYYCGGMAAWLSEIYEALGYWSYTIDFAVCNEAGDVLASHVMTLVKYQNKWIVEDPTFNCSYTDERGNILDIREIQRRVEMKEIVKCMSGSVNTKWLISASPTYEGIYECVGSYAENGIYFYLIQMDADVLLNSQEKKLKPVFEKDNLALQSENLFYYFLDIYDLRSGERSILYDALRHER